MSGAVRPSNLKGHFFHCHDSCDIYNCSSISSPVGGFDIRVSWHPFFDTYLERIG